MTVRPGEPMRIAAATWNAVERLVGPGEGASLGTPRALGPWAAGRDVVKVINNTDTTFEVYEAVPLSLPWIANAPTLAAPLTRDAVPTLDIRQAGWSGLTGAGGSDDRARFGILQDRLEPGKIVDCVIGGWTWARLKRLTPRDHWFGPDASAADPGVLRGRKAGGPAEWIASVDTDTAGPALGETFLGVVYLTNWVPDLYLWQAQGGTLESPLDWEVPSTGIFVPTGIGGYVPFGTWQDVSAGGCWQVLNDGVQLRVTRRGIYRVGGMCTCSIGSPVVSGTGVLRTYHLQWGIAQSDGGYVGTWGTHAHAATVEGEAPPWTTLVTSTLMRVVSSPVDVTFHITSTSHFLCLVKQFSLYFQWIGHHRPG